MIPHSRKMRAVWALLATLRARLATKSSAMVSSPDSGHVESITNLDSAKPSMQHDPSWCRGI